MNKNRKCILECVENLEGHFQPTKRYPVKSGSLIGIMVLSEENSSSVTYNIIVAHDSSNINALGTGGVLAVSPTLQFQQTEPQQYQRQQSQQHNEYYDLVLD